MPITADHGARDHLERIQVDVRLVEVVKQHEAVHANGIQLLGHVPQVAVERTQLHRQRDADGLSHLADQLQSGLFQACPRQARVGRYGVTFSSSASAPACSIKRAYLSQPPEDTPFSLPIIGIPTASLARRTCSRYWYGLLRARCWAGGCCPASEPPPGVEKLHKPSKPTQSAAI